MSDLFHRAVPTEFILSVFDVMNQASQHTFQVLTKRPGGVNRLNRKLKWTDNIWMGVSVESERWLDRGDLLTSTDASIKFLSLEPLLGALPSLDLDGIDWVIVGGESGPGARPVDPDWVREIRNNCVCNDVPFFFKQWGGVFKKRSGRILDGCTWDEMPQIDSIASVPPTIDES